MNELKQYDKLVKAILQPVSYLKTTKALITAQADQRHKQCNEGNDNILGSGRMKPGHQLGLQRRQLWDEAG